MITSIRAVLICCGTETLDPKFNGKKFNDE